MKGKLLAAVQMEGKNATVVMDVDGESRTTANAFVPGDYTAQILKEAVVGNTLELTLGTTKRNTPMITKAVNVDKPAPAGGGYSGGGGGFKKGGFTQNNPSAAAGGLVHDVMTLVAARVTAKTTGDEIVTMVKEAEMIVTASRRRLIAAVEGGKPVATPVVPTAAPVPAAVSTVTTTETVNFGE